MVSFIVNVQICQKPDTLTESKCHLRRNAVTTFFMIILALSFVLMPFLPSAKAANVEITYISLPTGHGKVGQQVSILGTVNASGDSYKIWFGTDTTGFVALVNGTTTTGNEVNATFSVPRTAGGNYTLRLQDASTNVNYTAWLYVDTTYLIEARNVTGNPIKAPSQLQEGASVSIWVNVTGAAASKAYAANITVRVPSPTNTTYWVTKPFTTTNTGDFSDLMTNYPDVAFHGTPPPHTNFTGTYTIAFNRTSSTALATNTFFVGLTNATEYHRKQYVDIKAVGYKPDEIVHVKINQGTTEMQKENVTAKSDGVVSANWTVPSNASIDVYTVNITSTRSGSDTTVKSPVDVQTFTVPGFNVSLITRNRAHELVPNVVVKVFENGKAAANATSNSTGSAPVKLEIGSYFVNATFKDKKVNETSLEVIGAMSFDLICNLTNLKILVITTDAIPIPDVEIYLTPDNQTLRTFVNGTAIAHSLLPVTSQQYVLNVSRYGQSFNITKISDLFVNGALVASFNVTVFCPTLSMQITALNLNGQPITNTTVKVQELIGGLYNETKTDSAGKAVFNFIFGRYIVGVYDADGIKLNETTVDLFQNQNVSIICTLYGLTLSVKVVDFLGQPISNVNVVLQREGMTTRSALTQSDGSVTFSGVTGGEFHVTIYLSDQSQPSVEGGFVVEKSETLEIKIDKYLLLAGMLVETGLFAIALVIVLTLLIVLVIELYRWRRHAKPKEKSGS